MAQTGAKRIAMKFVLVPFLVSIMQAPNNEEICKLVGIPFAYGGRDLAAFDCYGLLVYLHAQQGIKIQDYVSMQDRATISATMLGGACLWEEIEQTSGAMVAFKVAGLVSHCGLVIDDDKFIHKEIQGQLL